MISAKTKTACQHLFQLKGLPDNFYQVVTAIYHPLSEMLMDMMRAQPLFISINGAQGSGKSTMTDFLKLIIESESEMRVAELSLDDFYLPRKDREKLAKKVHPLLSTRGVPGTHDIQLLEKVLDQLLNKRSCIVPKFNKAIDDRCQKEEWLAIDKPVDIILFEGWCNNSPPQNSDELKQSINSLEEKEDAEGIWRQFANDNLIEYQKKVFQFADACIMLKAPDFASVFYWRALQEKKLRTAIGHSGLDAAESLTLMDEKALKRFIQHFERITRHTLKHLPAKADIVLPLEKDHSIRAIELSSCYSSHSTR
jgi:D-glycerate 3-kinase